MLVAAPLPAYLRPENEIHGRPTRFVTIVGERQGSEVDMPKHGAYAIDKSVNPITIRLKVDTAPSHQPDLII